MRTTKALPPRRTLLRAVASRDRSWDGLFVFGVRTTRVACRPGCPSRRARPEHVEFFATLDEALGAGFRPCRRCHPEGTTTPWWWRTAVDLAERSPRGRVSDAELRAAGLDPVRLRRHALRVHGVTFQAWCRARGIARAQRRLQTGASVDTVILESGYDSHSGFRDAFARVTGRAPGRARDTEPIALAQVDSPVGPLVAGAVAAGVCLLEFGDRGRVEQQAARLAAHFGGPLVADDHPHLAQLRGELGEYFAGQRRGFSVPLAMRGTPFELATWEALRSIPWGETRSYRQVAEAIGNPGAVRAVGSANGRNRIAIVVPCHRVVNADGRLGGYGGGLWRKRRLLELEQGG